MHYEIIAADDQISFSTKDALTALNLIAFDVTTLDAASQPPQYTLDAAGRPPAPTPATPSSTR